MQLPPELDDESLVPVTVMLTPPQVVRLEVLAAKLREIDPSIEDNNVADAIFDTGLSAYEKTMETAA